MEGHGKFIKIGKSFCVGIVGLGEGKGLLKGLHGYPELKVMGICDVNHELVGELKRQFRVPYAYDNR